MHGHFLGADDASAIDVRLELEIDSAQARWAVKSLSGDAATIVASRHRLVNAHLRQLRQAIQRENARNRPVRAVPKPAMRRRRQPVPVPCPDCHGVEPERFDCERCQGAGVVPG